MATYQLLNEGGASLSNSPSTGDIYSYHSEYATTIGAPCTEYAVGPANVYTRSFANAFVVANYGKTTASVALPSGHTFTDLEGRAVSNPLSVAADDGYVLLTTALCT
jgi:hypothetical protein